uniref:GC-rich sequence DNA-binding factor 1 n=1 Tax=Anthurium amnicola TaxID=1678845 RepID=A0A1D1YLK2_9ARAE
MSSGGSKIRNFRRRSDDDANGDEKTTPSSATPAASTSGGRGKGGDPSRPKTNKPRSLLSFADDDEDGRPAPRPTASRPPSSSSATASKQAPIHKLTSSKDRAAATPLPKISSLKPQAGQYTKEKLLELQKNARPLGSFPKPVSQLPSSSAPADPTKPNKTEAPAQPVIVLKGLAGLVKAAVVQEKEDAQAVVRPQREQDDEMVEVEELEEKGDLERRRFARMGVDERGKDSSLIPDQATINAIRAKRERLRQSRAAAPDYISLDGSSAPARGGGASSDEEDHDFRGRISLLGDKVDSVSTKGIFESTEEKAAVVERRVMDGGVVDEEDEEERIWEEEQFRKGLGKRFEESSSGRGVNDTLTVPTIQSQAPASSEAAFPLFSNSMPLDTGFGVSRSAEIMSISQHSEVAMRALQENIVKLRETHNRTLSSLVKTDENLSEALSDITSLEKSLSAADNKFIFIQKLRNFVSIMCSFLQDKAPYIEELEEQMQELHERRALAVTERRAADNADEMAEVEAAVNAAVAVLSKGSSTTLVSAAATAAQVAAAAAKESLNLPVQLDEFGRDLNRQKRLDVERRTEARKHRKSRSESKRMSSIANGGAYSHVEGESSTDESDSGFGAYESSRNEYLQTAEGVFSDAADEFSKLSVVKERLEEWKKLYSSSYRDAFMSLSIPQIFSPYVRMELLKWDPLYRRSDFYNMKWHDQLFTYGLQENEENFDPDDPDASLIPELVEQVALPMLYHEIKYCWDILSTRMTENAVFATNLVISYLQPSSKKLGELVAEIRTRLAEAIENLNVPTWSASVIRAVPNAGHIAAYQFGRSVRLLKNICLWKDILTTSVLEELALDALFSDKILPHLRSVMPNIHDAITRTERVIASLSGVWSGPSVKGDQGRKLQPLVDCVMELGRKLEKRHASGIEEDTVGLARRLKKMLVELNEYDRARTILRTFKLKEAL